MDIIPIKTLFDDAEQTTPSAATRKALALADVIIGVDLDTQREFTVFGLPPLEETVRLGHEVALRTVRIGLHAKAGELEKLMSLVQAIKRT